MDIATKLFQPFLLPDTEMLFLIDDQQAEMVEADGFCQQRMRSNGDLHIARGDAGADLLGLAGRCHPRQHPDFHREPGKALGKEPSMLAGQKRGWRHKRHLIAGHGGDKGGAQRHLGLAKADIAADQPVGGASRGEVTNDILNRAKLVIGLGETEAGAEFGIASRLRL